MMEKTSGNENPLDIDILIILRTGKSDLKLLANLEKVIVTSIQDFLARQVLLSDTEEKQFIDSKGSLRTRKSNYHIE